ncbi:alpha/beta-Hydrolase [Glarea lozoyensis ATCC 20868]|uniref:Alpha/beta-Hydrolase n=1 Tax=Glarea lozoyensis (strain ATCC 20868 / MF5171) TaxID=1116229 RepID=S3E139_GLAL2|nr:alpha/beta-Hydrolase [Glarea lozoyensis ATCC 20868]EPE32223.1 alpha/beta-Hydrolase [Glarea lozoyensis ATCC 20868]
MSQSRFAPFTPNDFTYKTVSQTPLQATVLVPKRIIEGGKSAKKCPVLVHFHGGALVVGDRMFEDWFAIWLLRFAEEQGAIIVTPDYRLMPEANGSEILDDVEDFWKWVHGGLAGCVKGLDLGVEVDLGRIAVCGESAGGYLSILSAMLFPFAKMRVVICQYGAVDYAHSVSVKHLERKAPMEEKTVDEYIASLKPGAVRVSDPFPGSAPLMMGVLREGKKLELLGKDERLFITKVLEKAGSVQVPPIWFVHGREDDMVLLENTVDFHKRLRELYPDTPALLSIKDGGHGFDVDMTGEEEWIREGCEFVRKFW